MSWTKASASPTCWMPQSPSTGSKGRVDWPRRFDNMQQHTGQHLLSAILADSFGYQTVAVHFGADSSSLDLDTGTIEPDQVRAAEARANAMVAENRAISVSFEEGASATGLRKASDRSGDLRIVTIDQIDRSACGGTHLRSTGELGSILIRGVERVKQQVRLQFLCGGRASRRARADFDLLSAMAEAASAGIDDLPTLFEKQRGEIKSLENNRRALDSELHGFRGRDLYHASAPNASGNRLILHRQTEGSVEQLRGLAQAVIAQPKAVFLGVIPSPATLLLAASADSGVDAGAVLKAVLSAHGGRGGGSPRIAQGTVGDPAHIEAALAALHAALSTIGSSPA